MDLIQIWIYIKIPNIYFSSVLNKNNSHVKIIINISFYARLKIETENEMDQVRKKKTQLDPAKSIRSEFVVPYRSNEHRDEEHAFCKKRSRCSTFNAVAPIQERQAYLQFVTFKGSDENGNNRVCAEQDSRRFVSLNKFDDFTYVAQDRFLFRCFSFS